MLPASLLAAAILVWLAREPTRDRAGGMNMRIYHGMARRGMVLAYQRIRTV